MRRALLWVCLGLAAGCSTSGGGQGTATTRAVAVPNVSLPPAQGETALDIRAVGPAGDERVGVPCTATSPLFTAGADAPARVLVPDYGPNAPEITVTCQGGRAAVVARPMLAWSGGLGGWPSVGMSVNSEGGVGLGVGWWGGGVGTGPAVVRYPVASVVME
jgi:hypothetical protein